jgi:hypothetical protein
MKGRKGDLARLQHIQEAIFYQAEINVTPKTANEK